MGYWVPYRAKYSIQRAYVQNIHSKWVSLRVPLPHLQRDLAFLILLKVERAEGTLSALFENFIRRVFIGDFSFLRV
jgi:hypothetical protein